MEICMNEFVRTKRGDINKVIGTREELRDGKRVYSHKAYYLDSRKGSLTEAFIVKHSKNIIDLIEVGDILRILDNLGGCEHKVDIDDKIFLEETKNNFKDKTWKLLSILTHEQFSSLEYII